MTWQKWIVGAAIAASCLLMACGAEPPESSELASERAVSESAAEPSAEGARQQAESEPLSSEVRELEQRAAEELAFELESAATEERPSVNPEAPPAPPPPAQPSAAPTRPSNESLQTESAPSSTAPQPPAVRMPRDGIAKRGRGPASVLKRSPPRAARAGAPKAAPKAASPEPPVSAELTSALVNKDLRYVNLYYGTNRARANSCLEFSTAMWDTPSDCRASSFYTGAPSALSDDQVPELEVGALTVTFPPDHESGAIERPAQIFSVTLRDENPEKDVVISELRSFGHDYEAWAEDLRRTGRDQAFIYVHGYATTFDQAARRAAQLAYDLDFDLQEDFRGLPMFYSWPSRGETGAYVADYDVSIDAVKAFNRFLDLVKVDAGVKRVHIIAHSMGNRLVANALAERTEPPGDLVDQLVLAAPDIWSREFRRRFLITLPRLATRVTLYVSDRDRALIAASKIRKDEPRAGQVNGGLLEASSSVEGFDAVDASNLPSDFLGHSYYASNDSMLSDIYCLLKGFPPEGRPLILKAGAAWTFKQGEDLKNIAGAACEVPFSIVFPMQWGFWWMVATAVFLIAVVIWLMRRRRSTGNVT